VWTAGHLKYRKTFVWKPYPHDATRNEVMSYTQWYDGEPNNYQDKKEDCLELRYLEEQVATGHGGKWNDMYCTWKSCFLCEING